MFLCSIAAAAFTISLSLSTKSLQSTKIEQLMNPHAIKTCKAFFCSLWVGVCTLSLALKNQNCLTVAEEGL
jgi:hypothetical protein